jgi:hypothetical protein
MILQSDAMTFSDLDDRRPLAGIDEPARRRHRYAIVGQTGDLSPSGDADNAARCNEWPPVCQRRRKPFGVSARR